MDFELALLLEAAAESGLSIQKHRSDLFALVVKDVGEVVRIDADGDYAAVRKGELVLRRRMPSAHFRFGAG